jgi:HK97 family phage portal protein
VRLFGLDITVKAAVPAGLQSPSSRRSAWWPIVREPHTGAWQRNLETSRESVLTYHAVYACVTLIASDVAKCRLRLVEQDGNGIWNEVQRNSPLWPVLRKPNRYQNRIKFIEQWVVSKLLAGNTYVLKERDSRGVVVRLYILDPTRVKPLVAPDGSVYYQINRDNLSGVQTDIQAIPASEIIHDVMVPLYHPLCGVSPLTACSVAAAQGLAIQESSGKFFLNGAQPSGILTAPGEITDEQLEEFKNTWEQKYTGANSGRVAILGGGLKYEPMSMSAVDSQLIEQLKMTAETVCSAFHVPGYKVGVGNPPSYNNVEALDQQYYSQCLQSLFECIELLLDEGLGLVDVPGVTYGTEFDLDDLLRMDTATLVKSLAEGVRGGLYAINEGRRKLGLGPKKGGETPFLQHQDYPIDMLADRERPQPGASSETTASDSSSGEDADNDNSDEALAATRQFARWLARDMLAA